MILEMIKDALKDHIILYSDNETGCIYDTRACAKVQDILNDSHVQNSVFIYPTNTEHHNEADYWCAFSWIEAGQIIMFGFNWMSTERQKCLECFNKTAQKGWM